MNKKRVGIIVSTLLVLVMSIALLEGCGLDINFRKKVEKKKSEKKAIAEDNKIIKSKKELEKKVQKETKDLALEEPEDLEKDNKKYEMTTYRSADGVEWELPDNFRSVVIGDLHGNIIFSKD